MSFASTRTKPLINIFYAHKPEVKTLKTLVGKSNLASEIYWYRWHTNLEQSPTLGARPNTPDESENLEGEASGKARNSGSPQDGLSLVGLRRRVPVGTRRSRNAVRRPSSKFAAGAEYLDRLLDKPSDKGRPGLLLNVGFAGRLNYDLDLGQVVFVSSLVTEEVRAKLDVLKTDAKTIKFLADRDIRCVSIATSGSPIITTSKRQELKRHTGADIVDMEAGHLYGLAREVDMPFVSFKLISDNADAGAWDTIRLHNDNWARRIGETVFDFLDFYLNERNRNYSGT